MTREEEIIARAKEAEKETTFSDIVRKAKGVCSAYGIGFLEGAQWADEHPNIDAFIEKACEGIEHLLSGYIIRNFYFGDSYRMDTLIEDFRRQMEE